MKNYKNLFVIILLFGFIYTQQNIGGQPFSKNNKVKLDIDRVVMESFNIQSMIEEDQLKKSGKMRYGKVFDTNISAHDKGTWEINEDGSVLWRLLITSPEFK